MSALTWDSDKNPNGFNHFVSQMDGMARNMKGGPELIEFADYKLDRKTVKESTVPTFISEDPDFDDPGFGGWYPRGGGYGGPPGGDPPDPRWPAGKHVVCRLFLSWSGATLGSCQVRKSSLQG